MRLRCWAAAALLCGLSACEDPQAPPPPLLPPEQSVSRVASEAFQVTFIFSDSARLKAKLTAGKVVERVETGTSNAPARSLYHLSRGVKILFFNPAGQQESMVVSDSGVFQRDRGLAELRGSVAVTSTYHERLDTELLYWNERKDSIYTPAPVRITTPTRVITGRDGLRSNTAFTAYQILGVQGVMQVEAE